MQKQFNYKLRLAVEKGDLMSCQKIINEAKRTKEVTCDLNCQGQEQWTLLHIATNEGNYSIVKLLLENKANPNTQSVNQRTALHISCMRGHPSIVKILLDYHSNIDIADMDGNTPVHLCSEFGHHDLLRFLLTKRPTLYVLNKYGKSPVDVAANSEILHIFDAHMNIIKNELFKNIAEMNGLSLENVNSSQNHRTKLVKVQDSLVFPSQSESNNLETPQSPELETKNHLMQQNLMLLHQQKFHPEMTKKYKFKEGKRLHDSDIIPDTEHKDSQEAEVIGPSSFVPIMVLGKGSFGEVYLVQKHSDKMFYAMKVLQKNKLMGQNLVKYARTERNVLSYTKHSFIVGLNYAFQTKEKLFLILDYCPGGDLSHVLAREKRFDEDRARIYLAEVILALEDLHKRDIIFRDLKPDNVVLDTDGHALLTDFGLSKEGIHDNNGAKSFCGSVAYLAPEILKRSGHGKSVDWYLLGVLFYEMLIGKPPYFDESKEVMFHNIQRGFLKMPVNLS